MDFLSGALTNVVRVAQPGPRAPPLGPLLQLHATDPTAPRVATCLNGRGRYALAMLRTLAAALRRRQVSSVEVAGCYLDRMDERDPRLTASCHRADDDVRKARVRRS